VAEIPIPSSHPEFLAVVGIHPFVAALVAASRPSIALAVEDSGGVGS
jgi:hypothetical protein